MQMPSLESARLVLRPLEQSDAEPIEAICSKPEVTRNLSRVPFPYPKGSAIQYINRQARGISGINYAIVQDGDFLGVIAIKPSSEKAVGAFTPAIGYWLDRPFWGKGYMQEAISSLLRWYMPMEPTERMRASVFEDNPRSLNLLTKLGFEEIGRGSGFSAARNETTPQIDLELTAQRFNEVMQ